MSSVIQPGTFVLVTTGKFKCKGATGLVLSPLARDEKNVASVRVRLFGIQSQQISWFDQSWTSKSFIISEQHLEVLNKEQFIQSLEEAAKKNKVEVVQHLNHLLSFRFLGLATARPVLQNLYPALQMKRKASRSLDSQASRENNSFPLFENENALDGFDENTNPNIRNAQTVKAEKKQDAPSVQNVETAKWLVEGEVSDSWIRVPTSQENILETAYKSNKWKCSFRLHNNSYEADLIDMNQTNLITKKVRALKRVVESFSRHLCNWPQSKFSALTFSVKPSHTLALSDFSRADGTPNLKELTEYVLSIRQTGSNNYTTPSARKALNAYKELQDRGLSSFMPLEYQDNVMLVLQEPQDAFYQDIWNRLSAQDRDRPFPPLVFQVQNTALWQSRMDYAQSQFKLAKMFNDQNTVSFSVSPPAPSTSGTLGSPSSAILCPFEQESPLAWMYCWHGTSLQAAQGILVKGIDYRFSENGGPRPGMHLQGKGNYVATPSSIWKSHNYTVPVTVNHGELREPMKEYWGSKKSVDKTHTKNAIFLLAVHSYVGVCSIGDSKRSVGPDLPSSSDLRLRNAHSSVDSLQDPCELCAFDPEQLNPVALVVLF